MDESTFENADSLDYDEWTKVFSDQDKLESNASDGQGAFLDYFDSPEVEVGGAADYDDELEDDESELDDEDSEEEADEDVDEEYEEEYDSDEYEEYEEDDEVEEEESDSSEEDE